MRRPVFVDDSGRRHRRVGWSLRALVLALLAGLAALIVSVVGGVSLPGLDAIFPPAHHDSSRADGRPLGDTRAGAGGARRAAHGTALHGPYANGGGPAQAVAATPSGVGGSPSRNRQGAVGVPSASSGVGTPTSAAATPTPSAAPAPSSTATSPRGQQHRQQLATLLPKASGLQRTPYGQQRTPHAHKPTTARSSTTPTNTPSGRAVGATTRVTSSSRG